MNQTGDRPFGWVAALAILCGAAVVVTALAALAVNLWAVVRVLL